MMKSKKTKTCNYYGTETHTILEGKEECVVGNFIVFTENAFIGLIRIAVYNKKGEIIGGWDCREFNEEEEQKVFETVVKNREETRGLREYQISRKVWQKYEELSNLMVEMAEFFDEETDSEMNDAYFEFYQAMSKNVPNQPKVRIKN